MITVQYRDVGRLRIGETALVWPVDHPSEHVSNATWARTSPVVGIANHLAAGPVFWTESGTRYVPAPTDETLPKASLVRRMKA